MAIFKCKMCGGTIEFEPGATVGICDSCGTKQTLPKTSNDVIANLFNRANNLRLKCEFDKAEQIYERIVQEDDSEAEAHWGIVLCKYGIEYVEDPKSHKRIPTCHRTLFDAVTSDPDYLAAIDYSDVTQQSIYESEARSIDRIQRDILAIVKNEKPFDVFICYKETDENGKRTVDSTIANDIYYQLTLEGFKVFFAAITLEDKLGQEYEPYIFAALNSAKVMLVIGTKPEYYNAVWVKNEWSRFLKLMKTDKSKLLIPCYRDMDAYDLPEDFAHLQAQDMGKIGFINDLVRGIKKVIRIENATPQAPSVTPTVATYSSNVTPLLRRAFIFLEDGEWVKADDFCEQVLNIDPENAQAYIGKMMAELHVKKQEELSDLEEPFDNNKNYQKALRYGNEEVVSVLSEYNREINERNENTRLTEIYNKAVKSMKAAASEADYKFAGREFETISGFKDADALAEECLEKAEVCRKDKIYNAAKAQKATRTLSGCEEAIKLLKTISGWKDADEQINDCQKSIEGIKAKEEADRIETERKAEIQRIAKEKVAKKRKKAIAICTPIALACISFVIVLAKFVIPNNKYNKALALLDEHNYEGAYEIFSSIDYKDSLKKAEECLYDKALALYNEKNYEAAYEVFSSINYMDSSDKAMECKYSIGLILYNAKDYNTAYEIFCNITYKDSMDKAIECQYNIAMALYKAEYYEAAYEAFNSIDYMDSSDKATECFFLLQISNVKVGDIIKFGQYEQDNKTSNGDEEIEWIVLSVDHNRVLLISRYALDCIQYNTEFKDVSWEDSYIRSWLNGTFYNSAFNNTQKRLIGKTVITNNKQDTNGTPNNGDKVFLLSIEEANKYFTSYNKIKRTCQGTAYCYSRGADKNGVWWWLRSANKSFCSAAYVGSSGGIVEAGFRVDSNLGVRPAIWIDLSK